MINCTSLIRVFENMKNKKIKRKISFCDTILEYAILCA